jgi:hypothetical protein
MLALEFFSWWYGKGWAGSLSRLEHRLKHTGESFSIGILLRTLFAPWRRIITNPGAGLDAHIRAIGDNIVSRFVGFGVRLVVLFTAAIMFCLVLLISIVELMVWPLLPVAAVGLVVWGLF